MRVEASSIQGKFHIAKLNGVKIDKAYLADDDEGFVEAYILNPEYYNYLEGLPGTVERKIKIQFSQEESYRNFGEVIGTFPVMNADVPPRFLCIRLRGNVEIIPSSSENQ